MIDATKIKVGDKVLLRNGQVRTVMEIKIDDHLEYPVNITFVGKDGYRTSYAPSGKFWVDRKDPWDILEINPAKTSEKEPIDATKIKVGDKVRLRNGEVKTVSTVTKISGPYPVRITFNDDSNIRYTNTGNWLYNSSGEEPWDILEIIPASEEKIDTKVNLDNLKVGDTIKLTDGTVGVVSEINLIPEDDKEFLKYAHRYEVFFLIEDGTLDGWNYRKDGTGDSLDGEEIIEIIPAETSEKTTDDIVTILSFSESEDNIISSLAGLQLTDRQIQGLNAMLTAFTDEAKRAWGWNLDVYIRNAPRTINRKQLEDERENYAWPPNPLIGNVIGLMSLTADEDDE